MLSGAKDGVAIIWRVKDWTALHKLQIKNVSPIKWISVHPSGKMALVLYENSMLRLWNLLDGRCVFKTNLAAEEDEEHTYGERKKELSDQEEMNDDPLAKRKLHYHKKEQKNLTVIIKGNVDRSKRPTKVLWNKTGSNFFIMYEKYFEVRSVSGEEKAFQLDQKEFSLHKFTDFTVLKEDSLVFVTNQGFFVHVTGLGSKNPSLEYKKSKYESFRLVDSSYLATPNSYNGK
jgi:WD40 repeat protein